MTSPAGVAGGGNTEGPRPMAAIMRNGAQELASCSSGTKDISSTRKAVPATTPASAAKDQEVDATRQAKGDGSAEAGGASPLASVDSFPESSLTARR